MPTATDDVRYSMNNFVICVGTYVAPLGDAAIAAARALDKVEIYMGETACKVPDAEPYIMKCRRGNPSPPSARRSASSESMQELGSCPRITLSTL